ncbi:hypothetical protein [Colwellia sp. TT2012]|uniref:hypothetical protein n=1 Tax=Colwellia sp. TT2012 TaxID=1720342 RepID=UPI00070F082E|nr:hypothetical protein [Colwellia sp. TT2012]
MKSVFAVNRCRYQTKRGYGCFYLVNQLQQKTVCTTITQKVRKSCEIDWYLQALLAYNMRFGAKCAVDENIDSKLDQIQHKKNKPRMFDFYNTALMSVMNL